MGIPDWYLDGYDEDSGKMLRISLNPLPFSVGRLADCQLCLKSPRISQHHAEFIPREAELWLRDLHSTNGTFINGQPLTSEQCLKAGDIIHFADLEFHLNQNQPRPISEAMLSTTMRMNKEEIHGARYRELRAMLQSGTVEALLQPIVSFDDNSVLGYEILGRGIVDGIAVAPKDLFPDAEAIGVAVDLSVLFRNKGLDEATALDDRREIFVNTHPLELRDHKALLDSLHALRQRHPHRPIVLEVHESAVTDAASLGQLSRHLGELGVWVAFDDFGTGQARLLELSDAAPRYIKFDESLIRNLHRVARKRRDMLKTLVGLMRDMEIIAIAEGIEKADEASACHELGFQFGQGYYFGRPATADAWTRN